MNGKWPDNYIDHINGIKTDNRIANLRDVSNSVNMQNRKIAMRKSKSGMLGVSDRGGKFVAMIDKKYIGTYATKEDAYDAYLERKRLLHQGCTI